MQGGRQHPLRQEFVHGSSKQVYGGAYLYHSLRSLPLSVCASYQLAPPYICKPLSFCLPVSNRLVIHRLPAPQAIAHDPENAVYWSNRAFCHLKMENFGLAIEVRSLSCCLILCPSSFNLDPPLYLLAAAVSSLCVLMKPKLSLILSGCHGGHRGKQEVCQVLLPTGRRLHGHGQVPRWP
jgi:hypothetical protein